ncbi:MAG: hypothetical protein R2701_01775 [Acidimicrobiales bacterium]
MQRTDGSEQSKAITVTSVDQHPEQAFYDDQSSSRATSTSRPATARSWPRT